MGAKARQGLRRRPEAHRRARRVGRSPPRRDARDGRRGLAQGRASRRRGGVVVGADGSRRARARGRDQRRQLDPELPRVPPRRVRRHVRGGIPVTYVDKTDAPMLIVNSTNELVPQSQADAMKAALDKAGVANQEVVLPGTAHSRAYSNQVWDQTVAFLENYLKR